MEWVSVKQSQDNESLKVLFVKKYYFVCFLRGRVAKGERSSFLLLYCRTGIIGMDPKIFTMTLTTALGTFSSV